MNIATKQEIIYIGNKLKIKIINKYKNNKKVFKNFISKLGDNFLY